MFDLKPTVKRMGIMADAYELLKIIDAEFRSDPMSVQCFDLTVVERVRRCIEAGERLNAELPDHIKL
jgi:hypothetical protein